MKYLFSKARYVVFSGPHCGGGLFFYVRGSSGLILVACKCQSCGKPNFNKISFIWIELSFGANFFVNFNTELCNVAYSMRVKKHCNERNTV